MSIVDLKILLHMKTESMLAPDGAFDTNQSSTGRLDSESIVFDEVFGCPHVSIVDIEVGIEAIPPMPIARRLRPMIA